MVKVLFLELGVDVGVLTFFFTTTPLREAFFISFLSGWGGLVCGFDVVGLLKGGGPFKLLLRAATALLCDTRELVGVKAMVGRIAYSLKDLSSSPSCFFRSRSSVACRSRIESRN